MDECFASLFVVVVGTLPGPQVELDGDPIEKTRTHSLTLNIRVELVLFVFPLVDSAAMMGILALMVHEKLGVSLIPDV